MDGQLPSEFDLIVVGTGLVESVVAAAASRIGKRVLHIDSNNYYGGLWASFNLDTINKINIDSNSPSEDLSQFLSHNEKACVTGNKLFDINIQSQEWHIPEKIDKPEVEQESASPPSQDILTQEKLLNDARKFNIDLTPKLHFARGEFVELLISSNIARYSEYRSVSRVITWLNDKLEIVPCSRSDVFSSVQVSVIEKRMLMKLLNACIDGEEEFSSYEGKTFRTYLKDRKLTDNLVHYVLYAIAMGTDDMTCVQGIENVRRFLNSLGRFGKTPFLYSMYGSGETSQAFCRLSAVFGAVYALSQNLKGFVFDQENNFKSLLCGEQRISAEHLVMNIQKLPDEFIDFEPTEFISRAVFLTDRSIMESEKEHLTLLLFPPENGKNGCTIIEAGLLTGTCPKNYYLVHMMTTKQVGPREDFQHCVEKLFQRADDNEAKPKILWSFYFSIPLTSFIKSKVSPNTYVCSGPDLDLDYDLAIKKAQGVFKEIYPDLEFLPRAPDPEEIVIEGDDDNNSDNEPVNVVQTVEENHPNEQGDHV